MEAKKLKLSELIYQFCLDAKPHEITPDNIHKYLRNKEVRDISVQDYDTMRRLFFFGGEEHIKHHTGDLIEFTEYYDQNEPYFLTKNDIEI